MADNGVVTAGGRLTDWVSLGVLAAFVPRDAVDDAVAAAGKQARRSDGKLPPHVMVYLVMALALFAEDDYEEVAARLAETLTAQVSSIDMARPRGSTLKAWMSRPPASSRGGLGAPAGGTPGDGGHADRFTENPPPPPGDRP